MYMTSHPARMQHKAILLWELYMNQDSCMAGPKNTWLYQHYPVGAPQMASNQFNPAKQVKPLGVGHLRPSVQ